MKYLTSINLIFFFIYLQLFGQRRLSKHGEKCEIPIKRLHLAHIYFISNLNKLNNNITQFVRSPGRWSISQALGHLAIWPFGHLATCGCWSISTDQPELDGFSFTVPRCLSCTQNRTIKMLFIYARVQILCAQKQKHLIYANVFVLVFIVANVAS